MAKLKSGKSKKGKGKKSPKKPTSILEITLSSDEDEEQDEESEGSSEAENSDEEEEQMDVDENEENTGKSLSEALLFFLHGENIMCTKFALNFRNNFSTQHVLLSLEFNKQSVVILWVS